MPLIRKWYNIYLGVDKSYIQASQGDGKKHLGTWTGRKKKYDENNPQLDLNWRCQVVLLYMVAHPDDKLTSLFQTMARSR